jgi:hypothetical protein
MATKETAETARRVCKLAAGTIAVHHAAIDGLGRKRRREPSTSIPVALTRPRHRHAGYLVVSGHEVFAKSVINGRLLDPSTRLAVRHDAQAVAGAMGRFHACLSR